MTYRMGRPHSIATLPKFITLHCGQLTITAQVHKSKPKIIPDFCMVSDAPKSEIALSGSLHRGAELSVKSTAARVRFEE